MQVCVKITRYVRTFLFSISALLIAVATALATLNAIVRFAGKGFTWSEELCSYCIVLMVYLAILLAILLAWFLGRTRAGLSLRAVGESPATADAAGINVTKYKYLATCIGGAMTGLGGLYLVMNAASGVGGAWVYNCIDGYGWLAVALVIFAVWSPKRALWCSLIFGGLACMRYYYPISFIPASIYDIVPYIVTAIVLVAVSLKHSRANQPPESLGLSYFREER